MDSKALLLIACLFCTKRNTDYEANLRLHVCSLVGAKPCGHLGGYAQDWTTGNDGTELIVNSTASNVSTKRRGKSS